MNKETERPNNPMYADPNTISKGPQDDDGKKMISINDMIKEVSAVISNNLMTEHDRSLLVHAFRALLETINTLEAKLKDKNDE